MAHTSAPGLLAISSNSNGEFLNDTDAMMGSMPDGGW
jgi:hypothetical protein